MDELEEKEKIIQAEIRELEANHIQLPYLDGVRDWFTEMLSIDDSGDWLENDPNVIRAILGQRIRVLCYKRKYRSNEPYLVVELCL